MRTMVQAPAVPVVFELAAWAGWRPRPVERVNARIVEPGVAELLASPFLAGGISRGDLVTVTPSERGLTVGALREAGSVSTVRIIGGSREELAPIVLDLGAAGIAARRHRDLPLAVLEIPDKRSLDAVLELTQGLCQCLAAIEVTCRRH